jgi:hypothetical protein
MSSLSYAVDTLENIQYDSYIYNNVLLPSLTSVDTCFLSIYTDHALLIYFFRKGSDIWRNLGAKTAIVRKWWI